MQKINYQALIRANSFLVFALSAKTDLEKAGAIQAFEVCFELSWKLLRRILTVRGLFVNSPKETLKEAFREKLITDLEKWFVFLENRNNTTHKYDGNVSLVIFSSLKEFTEEVNTLIKTFSQLKECYL